MVQPSSTPATAWTFTHHLKQRAAQRGITDAAIIEVLHTPDVTYPQSAFGSDRQVRQRGELAVVVNPLTHMVITVLFRDYDRWTSYLAAGAPGAA